MRRLKSPMFTEHKARIKAELVSAGVTKYGLAKLEAKHLPEIIHPDEHIDAVAYGLNQNFSAMLVATDRRVLYLDRKPFFTISDELTYEMVAGVGYNVQGRFAAVTLHTRIGDYPLRFVNLKAAEKFVKCIEKRRIEVLNGARPNTNYLADDPKDIKLPAPAKQADMLSDEGRDFLRKNRVGILSSINRTGSVHGAVVFYFVDAEDNIYILTKSGTNKAHNILSNPQVSITIFNEKGLQTLQIQGLAGIEPDRNIRDFIYNELTRVKANGEQNLPPVTKLSFGEFMVIKIRPTNAVYSDFKKDQ